MGERKRWLVTMTREATVIVEAPEGTPQHLIERAAERYDSIGDPDSVYVREATPADDPEDDGPEYRINADGSRYEPPPEPLGEPEDDDWIRVGGHDWATDGWCCVRRDGPRPAPEYMGGYQGWRNDIEPERVAPALAPTGTPLRVEGDGPNASRYADGERNIPTIRLVREDGLVAHVRRDFGSLLAAGEARQHGNAVTPIVVVRDGETVAVLMPIIVDHEARDDR